MAIYIHTWTLAADGPGAPSPHQINLSLGSWKNIKAVRVTMLGTRDTMPDQKVYYRLQYTEPDRMSHLIINHVTLPGVEYKTTETGTYTIKDFKIKINNYTLAVPLEPYWLAFKIEFSEEADLPPEELIPGQRFCLDGHLYEVGADGTSWFLIEANAEICKLPGVCPDFWVDPVGAVVCWILNAFEAAIGLMEGGFYLLQQNMASFIDDFGAAIIAFLDDPVTQIQNWMSGVFVTLAALTAAITLEINNWWAGIVNTINTWMSDTWNDLTTFWSDVTTHIGTWWDGLVLSTGAWIAAAWVNITTFWEDVTVHIETWWSGVVVDFGTWVTDAWENVNTFWNDMQTHFGTWWEGARSDVGEWWNSKTEAVVNGWNDFVAGVGEAWDSLLFTINLIIDSQVIMIQTWLESWVPEEIEKMFALPEWITAPFTAIGNFAQAIVDMLAGTYPKEEAVTEAEETVKSHSDRIKEIIEEME